MALVIWPHIPTKELIVIRQTLVPALLLSALCGPLAGAQSAPAWHERISIFGDFRFRHEYASKTSSATMARHRERFRLRVGVQSQLTEDIKAKARLATGDGGSPTSGNATMTDNANKKAIGVDMAMLEWKFIDGGNVTLGKM